ncbi:MULTISPECIES: fatty acid desaturase [unclassified Gordonia (in: high G+C Gram-positive bacteria)]|uniref:fatty acid desaturase family protein n=1 Tax=unclassified Gordonia (in: high G+C Gram-positive bacteria) TaxID=2657482 RepID=UPI0010F72B55|nr:MULTISPECIES: fatty acid desaturase [unclassified Gordonia (in: high G+C Gram-positive bacteria)]MCX2753949.1 fatty acid desaturase [Gordonia sp. 4N]
MAITDIDQYAHLTESDIETLGAELDAIRRDIEESRGEADAKYIRRAITLQRSLAAGGRLALMFSDKKVAWAAGTAMLSLAKIIENMELGHNVMHGQWDWMNDPEVHSASWEWDTTCPSVQWKHSHNFVHHKYTNVVGMDDDVGYGILRVTRDQPWEWWNVGNPIYNLTLGTFFEYGVALHHLETEKLRNKEKTYRQAAKDLRVIGTKVGKQAAKDYLIFPALAGPNWKTTLTANFTSNIIRNYWAYMVIFCGHFPDGAEKFTVDEFENEDQPRWYLRQMLGSANFKAGPLMRFMSGNLSHQIEHHLFPDLPSSRYEEIGVRVRELCDKYDLPYTTGTLLGQYAQSFRTIAKLALPNSLLKATSDDAPETASELRFAIREGMSDHFGVDPETGKRRGLRTALRELKNSPVRSAHVGRAASGSPGRNQH